MRFLEDAPLAGKRVMVRVVADVPIKECDGELVVADDYRLRQLLPTLHYLLDYNAKVILVSHLGRPDGEVQKKLSLRPVWLHLSALLKKPIAFAPTLFSEATQKAVEGLGNGQILALENLRFDPQEEANSRTFAAKLARYADVYVNDAFSVSHHTAASLNAITEILPSYAGLLLEKEIRMLESLMKHPVHPYVAVIGGAKISDKLPMIRQLVKKADWILTGGGVANTLLKASGNVDVKDSLIDPDSLETARTVLREGRGKIILPDDFIWEGDAIIDVGVKTIQKYNKFLDKAHTIFWTGPLGKVESHRASRASQAIARHIASTDGTTIVGGGDTVRFVNEEHLASKFSFVSTGGSATLRYLGGQSLSAISALENAHH